MGERLEYGLVWTLLKFLGILPRPLARWTAARLAALVFAIYPPWNRVILFNLGLAFPDWDQARRQRVAHEMVRNIGWMAAEFAHFPHNSPADWHRILEVEGAANFAAAEACGKGVLLLTGHLGAWELLPFAAFVRPAYGVPKYFVARAIDNPRLDALINRYRAFSGNLQINKDQAARGALRVLRNRGAVGLLIDQNSSPEESIFVNFFGIPAATTAGLARLARHTGAPVVPAYVYWDHALQKYKACAEPALTLERTGDQEADIREYTARFNSIIEAFIRRFPDQWLWAHRRWKNRPPGEPPIYPD